MTPWPGYLFSLKYDSVWESLEKWLAWVYISFTWPVNRVISFQKMTRFLKMTRLPSLFLRRHQHFFRNGCRSPFTTSAPARIFAYLHIFAYSGQLFWVTSFGHFFVVVAPVTGTKSSWWNLCSVNQIKTKRLIKTKQSFERAKTGNVTSNQEFTNQSL